MSKTARIQFLQNTFGNSKGDVVRVIAETNGEVYYNDCFRRYCFLYKHEEGSVFKCIPAEVRRNERISKTTNAEQ